MAKNLQPPPDDEPTPASENPFYIMATLHGQQSDRPERFDRDLHELNKTAWNKWVSSEISDERRAELKRHGYEKRDLIGYADEAERAKYSDLFRERAKKLTLPSASGVAGFAGCVFDRNVCLDGFHFFWGANFSKARFQKSCKISQARFFGAAIFHETEFCDTAEFLNTKFEDSVSFAKSRFEKRADLNFITASKSALFNDASFSGEVGFSEAVIFGGSFKNTIFHSTVSFAAAKFNSSSNFSGMECFETCSFSITQFSGTAVLERSVFRGPAIFGKSTFGNDARFGESQFRDAAIFKGATFGGDTNFNKAKFLGLVLFRDAVFKGTVSFRHAHFHRSIDFLAAKFGDQAFFVDASFETHVPDFRAAKLHEATEFHGVTWPKVPATRDEAISQVNAYSKLKQEMDGFKRHGDEQFFFRRELRASRMLEPRTSPKRLLNLGYDILSDFGESIGRPLFFLLALFCGGFWIFANVPNRNGLPMEIGKAASLSLANIFPVLPVSRHFADHDLVLLLQLVSTVQSVASLSLLFVLGLALRNRFRMK